MVTFTGTEAKIAVDVDNGVAAVDSLVTDLVQSMSFEFEGNLTDVYQLGARLPVEIKEGTIAISGTISRFFGEADPFSASATSFAGMAIDDPLVNFFVALFPDGTDDPKILISNCKFGSYSISVDVTGQTIETVSFHGKAIAVT